MNKKIKSEILIDKIDAEAFFTADAKLVIRRAVKAKNAVALDNLGIERQGNLSCDLTSINDHRIFETLSETVQQLLPLSVSLIFEEYFNFIGHQM